MNRLFERLRAFSLRNRLKKYAPQWRVATKEEASEISGAEGKIFNRRKFIKIFGAGVCGVGIDSAAGTKLVYEAANVDKNIIKKTPEIFYGIVIELGLPLDEKQPESIKNWIEWKNYITPPKVSPVSNFDFEITIAGKYSWDGEKDVRIKESAISAHVLAHELGHALHDRYFLYYSDSYIAEKEIQRTENKTTVSYKEYESYPGFRNLKVLEIPGHADYIEELTGKSVEQEGSDAFREFFAFSAELILFPDSFFDFWRLISVGDSEAHKTGTALVFDAVKTYGFEDFKKIVAHLLTSFGDYKLGVSTFEGASAVIDRAAKDIGISKKNSAPDLKILVKKANAKFIAAGVSFALILKFINDMYKTGKPISRRELLKKAAIALGVMFIIGETVEVL